MQMWDLVKQPMEGLHLFLILEPEVGRAGSEKEPEYEIQGAKMNLNP